MSASVALIAKKHFSRWFLGRGADALSPPPGEVPVEQKVDLADGSDEDLMLAYQQGHESAFAALLARHQKSLYNYLLRSLRNPELAEEAFQDIFLKLVRTRGAYRVSAKFTTWLYTMARNHCIDLARRGRFRQHLSIEKSLEDENTRATFEAFLASPESVDDTSSAHELQGHLQKILKELNPDQREVFLLREFQGLALDEIARVTDVSVNTVKSRMRYALEAIQKRFSELGMTSP